MQRHSGWMVSISDFNPKVGYIRDLATTIVLFPWPRNFVPHFLPHPGIKLDTTKYINNTGGGGGVGM